MYSIKKNKLMYKPYKEKYTLYDRVEKMKEAKIGGRKNVVYIVPSEYNQSIRYRAENMIAALEMDAEWVATLFEDINENIVINIMKYIDLIIFERPRYSNVVEIIKNAKKNNVKCIFDIDDYQFHSEVFSFPTDKKNVINNMKNVNSEYQKLIEKCDAICTTTSFLKNEIEKVYDIPVYKIKNFCDAKQIEIARDYIRQKSYSYSNKKFIIGYFAGNSHFRDLDMISKQLYDFVKLHNKVEIRIGGMTEIPYILKSIRCRSFPYMDGYSLMKEFAECDVNLIPLVKSPFSEARSEIKYFEASLVGTVSIMSPMQVYKDIKERGFEGYLAEDDKWYTTLEMLLKKQNDLIKKISNLHEDAVREYSYLPYMNVIKKMYDEVSIKN